jgi:drug/metabolite transporter (DMT)-like permease
MKSYTLIGIILIVVGAMGLIYGGITYTSKKDVVDFGSVKVQTETKEQFPLSPILGGTAVVAGIVLVVLGQRRSPRGPAA